MKTLTAVFCLLILTWAIGLYVSALKTKEAVREFYRWAHHDTSLDYDSYTEEAVETAPQLVERFNASEQSFKNHIIISTTATPPRKLPWSYFSTEFGNASNGSGYETGLSLTSSHYFAMIRTAIEPHEVTLGVIRVSAERSLFGL